jgi:hypothetical protein
MSKQRAFRGAWGWRGLALLGAFVASGAFAAPVMADPEADTTVILESDGGATKRSAAIDRLWAAVEAGSYDRAKARETLKQVMWKGSAPSPLRLHALGKLFSDETPDGQADNRKLLRLRLPTESQWPVIEAICKEITKRASDVAWREVSGPLVRSYARKVPSPPDADRPEKPALLALYSGESIEKIVFGVYMKPQGDGELSGQTTELVEKQRQAAWELLGRLDPDGSKRRELLAGVAADDPAIKPVSRAASELRVVPVTGSELAWVKSLLDSKDPGASDWWSSAQAAVQALSPEQAKGLQLRHVEPVRWASKHHPEWVSADRAALLAELGKRLEPRHKWRKTEGLGNGETMSHEALLDWKDALAWGDVLAILVIDEAIKEDRVVASLFTQAEADRTDSSAEYGGVIFASDAVPMTTSGGKTKPKWDVDPAGPGFMVRGYAPRPVQRINDRTFVASDEMFDAEGAGGRALAHYHFHAQSVNNADYAGPGRGDFEYANNHGRSCLVFTSVRPGVLNVDYYQRTDPASVPAGFGSGSGAGVQIDLGEVSSSR